MVAIVVFSAMEVVEMDSTDIAQEIEVPPCKKLHEGTLLKQLARLAKRRRKQESY